MLKVEIKTWKKENGTSKTKEIEEIEDKLTTLDMKLESEEWEEEDRDQRRILHLALEDHCLKRDRLAA
ncbi:hypothetical protein ACS0TY_026207 [Phlomoides rotata]